MKDTIESLLPLVATPAKWVLGILIGIVVLRRVIAAVQHISTHGTEHFRGFVIMLAATFALPLYVLVLSPALRAQHIHAVAYDKDRDGVEGFFPTSSTRTGLGESVYAREGCAQCHTQMIRPAQIALDGWRQGAGENQDARAPGPVRSNVLRDYLGEQYAFLGIQRNGPDLTNAGYRFADKRDQLHLHLYAPRQLNGWSNAPGYRHLYETRRVEGAPSAKALKLDAAHAPSPGYEVVPTAEAEALADYLVSLKRDALIPGSSPAAAAPAKK